MKRTRPIRYILITITLLSLYACSNSGKQDRPDDSTEGHPPSLNQPREDYGTGTNWSAFVKEAASDGLMEIQMGKIAVENAQNKRVKELARMIMLDHEKANERLKQIAGANEIPSDMLDKHKDKALELKNVPPGEFDERYLELMIESHEKAIGKFEDVLINGGESTSKSADTAPSDEQNQTARDDKEASIIGWIQETLPVLEKHLQQLEEAHNQLNPGSRT